MLYDVIGLSKQIELSVPLIHGIIPYTDFYIPQIRPGYQLRSWPRPKWIQHETANTTFGADADMHWRWLLGGASGQWVSFHFAVDDKQIYQLIPINEVTWQAADGDGPGNWECISSELCVNIDGDETKARHNAEELCGGVMKALGWTDASGVGRHWDYNYNDPDRHHCPDHMMNEGYWPTFVTNVNRIITATQEAEVPPVSDELDLPDGLSVQMLGRLFNPFKVTNPDSGVIAQFDPDGPVSKAWLNQALASIPPGAHWTKGNFCPLTSCIRRGDGVAKVWQFTSFITEK